MKNYLQEFTYRNIYVRHAIDYGPDDQCFHMHIHAECEIFYFLSGHAECLVEGSIYPLEPGSLIIMRPAESHKVKILQSKQYERCTLNFPVSIADSIDPDRILMRPFLDRPLGMGNLYSPMEIKSFSFETYFKRMCSCNDAYTAALESQLCLYSILDSIRIAYLKRDVEEYAASQTRAGQMLAYVNEHLFEDISIPSLAEHFFLSAAQFNRVFKAAAGSSPWEYILLKRLTAAKEKIRSGTQAVKACTDCGFGDYSVFFRAYKKHFGCSPKEDMK